MAAQDPDLGFSLGSRFVEFRVWDLRFRVLGPGWGRLKPCGGASSGGVGGFSVLRSLVNLVVRMQHSYKLPSCNEVQRIFESMVPSSYYSYRIIKSILAIPQAHTLNRSPFL